MIACWEQRRQESSILSVCRKGFELYANSLISKSALNLARSQSACEVGDNFSAEIWYYNLLTKFWNSIFQISFIRHTRSSQYISAMCQLWHKLLIGANTFGWWVYLHFLNLIFILKLAYGFSNFYFLSHESEDSRYLYYFMLWHFENCYNLTGHHHSLNLLERTFSNLGYIVETVENLTHSK